MFLFGNHKKRTVKPIKLWDEILSAMLSKNKCEASGMRNDNFYMDLKGMYSGQDNVTYMYTLDGYPAELEMSYRSILRRECREGVRMSFVSTFERHQIAWHSPQMKSKLRTWRTLDATEDEIDEYNMYDNLSLMDSQLWRRRSLTYLSAAELRRRRKMYRFRSVVFVSGRRGENFEETIDGLIVCCANMGIKLTRVMLNIQDYLEVFSPFSLKYNDKVIKSVGNNVLTDELLARFSTYSQGIVGKEGIYWGTDIDSNFPCLKPVKVTSGSAENWLITAETGGGKSYFVKSLVLQLLASPNVNGTIMDIEGFEYAPLDVLINQSEDAVTINMSEGSGSYYDPVEIVLTGDEKLDEDMKGLSTSFTLSIFKTLLGGTSEDEWVDIAINDAVSLTYTKAGVSDSDPSTWGKSKGLTLFDVYSTLKDLLEDVDTERAIANKFEHSLYEERAGIGKAMSQNDVNRLISKNAEYQRGIERAIAKTSRYFEPSGTRAEVFSNRISTEDVTDAKLVICSFGMAGKTEKNVDPIQMALMQLCAANISYLRSVFSKRVGKFNFKLWEEFQRWGNFPDSDKTITTALTGGRKLGDMNIILTNKVGELLSNDKFGVFSNTTSFAIGCIGDADIREELCRRLTIPNLKRDLDTLANENKDLSAYINGDIMLRNRYSKAFLIGLDRTVYTLAKMSLPQDLAQSELFQPQGTAFDDFFEEDEEEYDYDEGVDIWSNSAD